MMVNGDDGQSVSVPRDLDERVGGKETLEGLLRNQAIAYGVDLAEMGNLELRAALMRSTVMALTYGFMPGQHLHLQVSGGNDDLNHARPRRAGVPQKTYTIVIGVHAYMDSFDQWKRDNRKLAWVHTAELVKGATAEVTRERYPHILGHPDDCGATARFLDQEEAEFCQKTGLSYNPPLHYGFWRRNAIERTEGGRKVWDPDMIPKQRAPMDVALLRATKACLMSRVPLQPVNQNTFTQRLAQLQDAIVPDIEPSELATAPLSDRRGDLIVEPDGDVLFVRPNPGKPMREIVFDGSEFN